MEKLISSLIYGLCMLAMVWLTIQAYEQAVWLMLPVFVGAGTWFGLRMMEELVDDAG